MASVIMVSWCTLVKGLREYLHRKNLELRITDKKFVIEALNHNIRFVCIAMHVSLSNK